MGNAPNAGALITSRAKLYAVNARPPLERSRVQLPQGDFYYLREESMKHRATIIHDGTTAIGYYCQVDERHWIILPVAQIMEVNATGRLAKMIDGIVEIDPDTLQPVRTFGDAIAERRKEMGWSQEELAARVSLSRSYVSQIERGETRNPAAFVLFDLGDALQIEDGELVRMFKEGVEWPTA
jgi:DNA-binding XRE family transcriptional regulator